VLAKEVPLAELQDFFSPGTPISVAELQPPSGVHHSHYLMNQRRDLAKDFQFVATEEIKSIEIVDRYLFAMDHNTDALEALLGTFAAMWKSKPERIALTYGPAGNPQDDQVWRNAAFNLVVALQKKPEFSGIIIQPTPRSYREPKGDKHDRRIRIQAKPTDAPVAASATSRRQRAGKTSQPKQVSRTFVAELTGGVSHLMDVTSETNVFTWVK
jgi:hypothetical protein